MRGLIIREPWTGHILQGRKTWEIRSRATSIREKVALIRGGSGLIVGVARLADCLGPFSFQDLVGRRDKHSAPADELRAFLDKYHDRAYAWVLEDVRALTKPVPYVHPSGAVIWVTLPDGIV